MLKCSKCKEWKDEGAFCPAKERPLRYYHSWCKSCTSAVAGASKKKRRDRGLCVQCGTKNDRPNRYICSLCAEKTAVRRRGCNQKLKRETFNAYGGAVCVCCGEGRIDFLSIDHIDGGGHQHRKERNNHSIYLWLSKNNYPEGYQVLCMNCNWAKGRLGYCPHEREKLYPKIYGKDDIDLSQWNMDLPMDKRPVFYGNTSVDLTQWKEAVGL